MRVDTLVVGAGYAGSIVAERLASQCGHRVLVIDRRGHIAGNAFDYVDDAGVLVHRYGPHIFHTNSDKVWEYLSQFTAWQPYEHRTLAVVRGGHMPIPINRTTLNLFYGVDLKTDAEAEAYLAELAEPRDFLRNSEDSVVAKVGRELYEAFFRGYTRKQWDLDPTELAASVTARIPVRFNTDDRYFTDTHQALPAEGYTAMFRRMLDHPLIEYRVDTDFFDVRDEVDFDHLVYTGPIDRYFGHRFGPLPYRSLEFELETHPTPNGELLQPAGQVNYPGEDVPYTRKTEFRHLTGQRHDRTTIAVEFPRAEGDPYYPVPRADNKELYKRYRALTEREPGVTFVGRLATYQYFNMDQVVAQALTTFERMLGEGRIPVLHA
jgi:UDP-galactopyranose mutase